MNITFNVKGMFFGKSGTNREQISHKVGRAGVMDRFLKVSWGLGYFVKGRDQDMGLSFQAVSQRTNMWGIVRRSQRESVFDLAGQKGKKKAAGPTFSVDLDALPKKEDGTSTKKTDKSLEEIYDAYIERQKNDVSTLPPGDVVTKTPINWDADGTSALTKEQIEHLRSVYDLSNMDKEDYWNLMADLTDMNVISARDIASQCVAKLPSGPVTAWYTIKNDETFGQLDHSGNIREDLLKCKKDLDLMMDWLKDCAMMDSSQFFQMRDDILFKSARVDRFMGIFELLDPDVF